MTAATSVDTGADAAEAGSARSGEQAETSTRRRSRWLRRTVLGAAAVLGLLLLYLAVTFVQVWQASRHDDARPAQAIVVLGAAQYDGRPSAVLAARLDHVVDLFQRGLAPLVVVTGGGQPGDRFTEAEASANYLMSRGVPGEAIERETTSTTTYDELAAAAVFLRERGVREVLLVSDPFHAYRIKAIADDLGLEAHVSPTHTSPVRGLDKLRALARETVAVAAGRVIGYDREDRLRG
jgi:uncharacterized SAM-binding protein YcdF (DUF218 family)